MNETHEVFEINTGLIPAAIYANKLRRTAFAILKKSVPSDVVMRDVAELNRQLYTKIVEEMRLERSDPIRISVEAIYDKSNNKLIFQNLKLIRYYSEDIIKSKYEKELEALNEENDRLRKKIDEMNKIINDLNKTIEDSKKEYELEINSLKEANSKYERELKELRERNQKLEEVIKEIISEIKTLLES